MKRRTSMVDTVVAKWERFFRNKDPPHRFPVQIGDPLLRMRAEKVNPEEINSEKIKTILKDMRYVLDRTESLGIAAPQVGASLRIFMTQLTEKGAKKHSVKLRNEQQIAPWPFKIFINPELEITDNRETSWPEGCISLLGYAASVPRFFAVKVEGLDEEGKPISWAASGFAARVIQHEMDHLNGMMYVDRMDTRTFEFVQWEKSRKQSLRRYLPSLR